ncbi:unnamed protein product [Symbiodinium microadriaticum]|nr:unnamed protein product [Symbiodinium microadriaticum]
MPWPQRALTFWRRRTSPGSRLWSSLANAAESRRSEACKSWLRRRRELRQTRLPTQHQPRQALFRPHIGGTSEFYRLAHGSGCTKISCQSALHQPSSP